MNKIKKNVLKNYNYKSCETSIAIYNELDFEGGFIDEMCLSEKRDFFRLASELYEILLKIFNCFSEKEIIIGPFENYINYCRWRNLNSFTIVKQLKEVIKNKEYIKIDTEKDFAVIEKITEGNMRYLSQISFYLPVNRIRIQIMHHTGFVLYSEKVEIIYPLIKELIKDYKGWISELRF